VRKILQICWSLFQFLCVAPFRVTAELLYISIDFLYVFELQPKHHTPVAPLYRQLCYSTAPPSSIPPTGCLLSDKNDFTIDDSAKVPSQGQRARRRGCGVFWRSSILFHFLYSSKRFPLYSHSFSANQALMLLPPPSSPPASSHSSPTN